MAIVAGLFKQEIQAVVFAGLASQFPQGTLADPTFNLKMSIAISGIADVIVTMLTTQATVSAGQPTAGSPTNQLTVGPGKIA